MGLETARLMMAYGKSTITLVFITITVAVVFTRKMIPER